MKIQTHTDGSVSFDESFRILRMLSLACAIAAVALFIGMVLGDYGEAGKAGWAALGVAVLCYAGMVANDRSFRFDAASKVVTWRQSNLFRTKHEQLPFSQIKDVIVVGERGRDDDTTIGGYTVRYRAALVMDSGNIPLSSFHSRREDDFRELADKIRDVLALPKTSQEDEAARLVAAGPMIDAIAFIRKRDGVDLNTAKAAAEKLQVKIPIR